MVRGRGPKSRPKDSYAKITIVDQLTVQDILRLHRHVALAAVRPYYSAPLAEESLAALFGGLLGLPGVFTHEFCSLLGNQDAQIGQHKHKTLRSNT